MAAGNRKKTTKKRLTKKERMAELEKEQAFRREIILWVIVAMALLLFVSNFGIGGVVGNGASSVMFGLFGVAAYVLPILILVGSFFACSNKGSALAVLKIIAAVVMLLYLCTFLSLIFSGGSLMEPFEAYRYCAQKKPGGGLFGGTIAYYLSQAFGIIGSYIITVIVMIICAVIITGRSAINGLKKGGQTVYESAKENSDKYQKLREYKKERRMDRKAQGVSSDTKIEKPAEEKSDEMGEIILEEEPVKPSFSGNFIPDEAVLDEPLADEPVVEEPKVSERIRRKAMPEAELAAEINEVEQEIAEVKQPKREYVFPPVDLLKKSKGAKSGNTQSQLLETAEKLKTTLKTFGVNVTVTNISCGPAVTRYEIQPEMGVKVSKIVGLADDIKLNLAAADIRMEAPIPGKAAIGIEVPNPENVTVSFRELIESKEFAQSKSKISFAVGKDISGKTMVSDIAKMPHLLIAGATGSGKSVCINTIIMSILYKADPKDVKLLMVDPKVVELSVYNGIPHLMIPVVTDPKKAAGALQWAVAEMTDRYEKFAEANVREINGYNSKIEKMKLPEGMERPEKMPQIVIIVDELADLMMVASGEIEESICRLAQLARAAGIHLVIATQRPSVNVITGLIKANMPSRIAFAVTSGVDSRTILDMNGAEKLLGKGDMLFHPQGIPKPLRVQGAFVSDGEVSSIVEFIKRENGMAEYSDTVQEKVESLQAQSNNKTVSIADADDGDDGRDPYFKDAGQVIVDKEKASIGMLQRYLKIGFNRAARIMDQLEEAGVVGPEEGTKPRTVLMSSLEFEDYINQNS